MKKIIPLLFIIILSAAPCFSKGFQKQVDSLQVLLKTNMADTVRLRLLGELCSNLQGAGNYKSQVEHAKELRQLAEKLLLTTKGKEQAYAKMMFGNSYLSEGRAQRGLGNFDEALKNALKAKEIFEEMDSLVHVARSFELMSNAVTDKGDLQEGIKYQEEGIAIYKKLGRKKELGRMLVNHGVSYIKVGDYAKALHNELEAVKILEEVQDSDWLATCYLNLGVISRKQGHLDESLKYYEKVLEITDKTGDAFNEASVHSSLGAVYTDMKKFDIALENYQIALKLYEQMGNKAEIVHMNTSIAAIYNLQEKRKEALELLQQSLQPAMETGSKELIGYVYYGIATNYSQLKRYNEAIEYFKKAIEYAKEMNSNAWLREYYYGLSWAYKENKDFKTAYDYHELYFQMNDSVYNETKSQQMAEMKAKYESEKKDAEIALLNKDTALKDAEIIKQKTLKYSFIMGLGVVAFLGFVVFTNVRVRNKLKLQTLRNKIASDLHDDVGSTLSSIAIFSEVAQQQSKEVVPMLNTISDSARNMLDAMADIVWTINPENDQFEKIILRMRNFSYELLGAKKIDFEFDADESSGKMKLPMDVRKNLYLIFKEATNNMVKYSEASKASFKIKGEKNNLTLLIRDNGKGFDINAESTGNGLKNMRKRAEEIGARLLIESIPGSGTTIQLMLAV
jgi:two-component system, NarL family, sensor histidine kinase UhpB